MGTLSEVAQQLQPDREGEGALVGRERRFSLVYKSPSGEYSDIITSRILSADERMEIGRIAGNLARPIQFDYLPASQQARIWAIAWCSKMLRDVPKWLDKWILEDDSLLFKLYEVLQEHDTTFFRSSGGEGEGDTVTERVAITPIDSTSASRKPTSTRL